ncbi:MAG: hypothetical protein E6L02_06445, partial [Thaumarchaeota archaeon]
MKIKLISLSLFFLLAISSLSIVNAEMMIFNSNNVKQNYIENVQQKIDQTDTRNSNVGKQLQVNLAEQVGIRTNDRPKQQDTPQTIGVSKTIKLSETIQISTHDIDQNTIVLLKQNFDTKTTMDRILNLDRIRFNGRSIVADNFLWNEQTPTIKLSGLMDNKLYSEPSINYDTANHFVKIPDKISFFGLPLEISKTYNDISAFFIQPNSLKNNIITSVSDVTDPKNPTIILFLVPLVGYILIRSKETRFQFSKSRQALSFCFIVILISSIVITPLSISSAYWHAYAEDINNTKSESVSAQHTSAAVPQTSNATQNTGSNTENSIVNSITSSIDKNKPIDEPKTLPAPTNYNLPINTTSLKIPTTSTTNTNVTSPVPTNATTQKTSATATSLSDMIRITDAIIVYVNSSIH